MTGTRILEEQDINAIRILILQLEENLGDVLDLDHAHYQRQYHAMQQYFDIYQNYVYCIDDELAGLDYRN